MLAAANVYFRDVEHILSALLLPWFFLTPIFYSPDVLPKGAEQFEWLAGVLAWGNWVSPFIDLVRDPVFFGQWPPLRDPGVLRRGRHPRHSRSACGSSTGSRPRWRSSCERCTARRGAPARSLAQVPRAP